MTRSQIIFIALTLFEIGLAIWEPTRVKAVLTLISVCLLILSFRNSW